MLMALLPLLIPIILLVVPTRFALSSRSSYARVKLLESDKETMARRLIVVWAKLGKEIEDAVEDVLEESILPSTDGGMTGNVTSIEVARSTPTNLGLDSTVGTLSSPPLPDTAAKPQPSLTSAQYRMMANLNTLTNLTKHVAYIDKVRNSHGMIICRNFASMISHRKGEGVVRAWADGMKP